MEQRNTEVTKKRLILKNRKEEVDRMRKQINADDLTIMAEREALRKRKDLIARQEIQVSEMTL
jgi:hypothetical protein